MSEVAGGGRTVLFVSHNLAAVEALCPRSLYLVAGALFEDSSSEAIIATYLKHSRESSREARARRRIIQEDLKLECTRLSTTRLVSGEPLEVEFEFSADQPGQLRECAVLVNSTKEVRLAIVDLRDCGVAPLRYGKGRFAIRTRIVSLPLVEGELMFGVYVVTDHFAGNLLDLAELTIVESRFTQGFSSYPADARGFFVLNATTSVVFDQPVEAM
jgi:lipopolysaccharide transport system ATP-binding protein